MNLNFNSIKEEILHPQDVSDMFSAEDIQSNKWSAAIATVQPLFFIPLLATPQSGFAKFYANQGLILLVMQIAGGIIGGIVGGILGLLGGLLASLIALIPYVGPIIGSVIGILFTFLAGLVGFVVGAAALAAFLLLLISALQGKARYIPVVGQLFTAFK